MPKNGCVVIAKEFSKKAEKKIIAAGGVCELRA
jgi:ribosomal protein L15